ncbi:hypothetical protein GOP47_0024778 [Adiantum capillus-veneris]|uniref:DEAD-box ATP-dependent RNA helicase 39 n=1 Tax=Adiantum capillus-veneris TaxID=13818 RepID=A0A9D4U2R3_ADICA|nr:hypothetical protein GOP47_0024778 [Adiantum capillus-veneris]
MAGITASRLTRSMDLHFLNTLAKTGQPLLLLRPRVPGHRQAAHLTLLAVAASSPPSSSLASADGSSTAVALLDKLRVRKLKGVPQTTTSHTPSRKKAGPSSTDSAAPEAIASSFEELPLTDELISAVNELGLTQPTEVQCRSIPAVLEGHSVVIASHTGSGKTLAYMIPLVQCLKEDELQLDKAPRPRRPRAIVLCPTRELAEQVFRVAKSICHHAKFRVTLIGGGVRMKPQEDALNAPIDMLVGTPGRLLQHIEDGNVAYGDIKYVVLDEADTMFDRGFGPDVKKFLGPLRSRSKKSENAGFQMVLVTATITKAVQTLLDDEFPGIKHIQTSTLHKKVSTARHGFIKLAGTENKLESLLQVLEPSLAKNERVMVFCNTLNSCRAVDHYLNENGVTTVNYHGAVPAEERVEVLNKFRTEEKCPALVCTDLAARGLDLVVDHVIMFDFPLNSIDYLHRTGRTARMGAKGKITSLVSKKSLALAELIEEAIHKGETLEGVSLLRKDTPEVRKQPVKKKTAEKGRAKRQVASLGGKSSKNPSRTRPASVTVNPYARGTRHVVSKGKKGPLVRVGVSKPDSQKGSRTGQKVMKVAGKR